MKTDFVGRELSAIKAAIPTSSTCRDLARHILENPVRKNQLTTPAFRKQKISELHCSRLEHFV